MLLLDRAGQVGGLLEHSEGKDGERTVAIPRFLCGSPLLCRLRTVLFWPRWQGLICTDSISGFMRPGKPSSFCNYFVESHLPASRWLVGERMRQPRQRSGRTILGGGARLHLGSTGPGLT
jgi:hypothetical protein